MDVFSQDQENPVNSSRNSINFGFASVQTSSLSVNYEHLFGTSNGMVLGLPVFNFYESTNRGFSLSYRRHLISGMNSGFWGIFVNYASITSEIRSDDVSTNNNNEYRFKSKSLSIGPNIGLRWVDQTGINIVIRAGYGIPFTTFKWVDTPADPKFAKHHETAFKVITGIDGELTIGYCF